MVAERHSQGAGRAARAAVGIVALSLLACDAPTYPAEVFAYDPTLLTGGLVYRWQPGRTIRIYADPTNGPTGFDIASAARAAATQWNDVTRFADYHLAVTDRSSDADVIVRFRTSPLLVDLRGCEPAGSGAGRTAFCTDSNPAPVLPFLASGGGHVKVDVYVDPTTRTAEQLAPFGLTPQTYFQALVTHELGHVVGIGGHSGDENDVMYGGFIRVTRPSERDARTLRWVWLQPVELLL
jgi:hypothetical protein